MIYAMILAAAVGALMGVAGAYIRVRWGQARLAASLHEVTSNSHRWGR